MGSLKVVWHSPHTGCTLTCLARQSHQKWPSSRLETRPLLRRDFVFQVSWQSEGRHGPSKSEKKRADTKKKLSSPDLGMSFFPRPWSLGLRPPIHSVVSTQVRCVLVWAWSCIRLESSSLEIWRALECATAVRKRNRHRNAVKKWIRLVWSSGSPGGSLVLCIQRIIAYAMRKIWYYRGGACACVKFSTLKVG